MSTITETTVQVYQVFIKASPEQIWEAIVDPTFTTKYFYGARITVTPERRSTTSPDGAESWGEGPVFEFDPPRRLVHQWQSLYDPGHLGDRAPGRRRLQADARPRPARGVAEDRRERVGRRLDVRAERPEDAARDGRVALVANGETGV